MAVLGLDVGATKTQALIADHKGEVLGFAREGGGNWEGIGLAAPHVFEVAQEGDEVARRIFKRAGRELGESAIAIIRRLGLNSEVFDLVLSGGMFRSGYRILVEELEKTVHVAVPSANPVMLAAPPVVGAALRAFGAVGTPMSDEGYHRLLNEAIEIHERRLLI